MSLSVIEGGKLDTRDLQAKKEKMLLAIAVDMKRDIEQALSLTGSQEIIETRHYEILHAAVAAQRRLIAQLGGSPAATHAEQQLVQERAKLREVKNILEELSTNLGLYLD